MQSLIQAAHRIGLDIRIGKAAELSDVVQHADRLYPYLPESLAGEPCARRRFGRFRRVSKAVASKAFIR